MSNITGDGESFPSENNIAGGCDQEVQQQQFHGSSATSQPPPPPVKKKRNLPGTPDPTAEVIALSPSTLMATNRFVCEICNKGFQRDQNLQLHRRGHNLPWKLRQRAAAEVRKRVYICPEPGCVHHNPTRALGDLTGIKKHFCRKHGEKKWKCDKCSKKYAVQSDWKAHSKTCGTREYKCDCGTIFSRRDSFITHRAFCDALAEENNHHPATTNTTTAAAFTPDDQLINIPNITKSSPAGPASISISGFQHSCQLLDVKQLPPAPSFKSMLSSTPSAAIFSPGPRSLPSSLHLSSSTDSNKMSMMSSAAHMSATALLQKAAQMGATAAGGGGSMAVLPYSYSNDGLGTSLIDGANGGGGGGGYMINHLIFDKEALMSTANETGMFHHQQQQQRQQSGGVVFGDDGSSTGLRKRSLEQERLHATNSTAWYNSNVNRTVDFLGLGGARMPVSLPPPPQRQGSRMDEFEAGMG